MHTQTEYKGVKINGLIKEKQRIENEIRANEEKLDMMTGKDIGYNSKY